MGLILRWYSQVVFPVGFSGEIRGWDSPMGFIMRWDSQVKFSGWIYHQQGFILRWDYLVGISSGILGWDS